MRKKSCERYREMNRGNPQNLTPFKKDHKKVGGRKAGVPNKIPRAEKEAVLAALDAIGLDGQGFGGRLGFFIRGGILHPDALAKLIGKTILRKDIPTVSYEMDYSKLTDEELIIWDRLIAKGLSSPRDEAPLQPFDQDEYKKKVDELLATAAAKRKKKVNRRR